MQEENTGIGYNTGINFHLIKLNLFGQLSKTQERCLNDAQRKSKKEGERHVLSQIN